MRIKKQYREAIKTQTLQYKALQKQIMDRTPKERHKELIKQLREDRMRKMADLSVQYDQSISEMLQRQTVSWGASVGGSIGLGVSQTRGEASAKQHEGELARF